MQIISVDNAEDLAAWQREYGPESVYVMHDPDYIYEEGQDSGEKGNYGYMVKKAPPEFFQQWMRGGTIYGVVIP